VSAALETTRYPGIYRRGGRYVVRVRDARGRQAQRSAATLAEARAVRDDLAADGRRGAIPDGRITLEDYAATWTESYRGRTGRGIRPATLADYKADLRGLVLPARVNGRPLGRYRLAEITPADVKALARALEEGGRRKRRSPARVRAIIAPLRALLATAREDGLIRDNPATDLHLSLRPPDDRSAEDEGNVRALSPEELARLIVAMPVGWPRLLVRFVAASGLRIGEAIALRWEDVDAEACRVRVRRRIYRGAEGSPKSRYGRREVPLPRDLVSDLRAHRLASPYSLDADPVFVTSVGTPHRPEHLRRRTLYPAVAAAGLEAVTFHTLRHTAASAWFARGASLVQVQRLLGHHSPAFTLATYVHLLGADDLPDPELLADLVADSGNVVREATPRR
jgi:integrase